ncbi:peptide-methionine (S)-S-oxide reductase [Mucilaginibacter sp. SD-g]|uniref:peptide-methionine (S)-S-oxide reductase n=2 Tax=Mucilaginibacter segetis TaxID=2793071 RepID=A0A934UMY1_9SPHI|nr:peptide-methionine (S)-S-oxide reductase [Mucilaginibacter segetis]
MINVGFGGSCHWCTEAIFQSLVGVTEVLQGWIDGSEAVIVIFDENVISLATLIEIHLATHSCTSEHSLRGKYRSAVYTNELGDTAQRIINGLQRDYKQPIITQVLPLGEFRLNNPQYLNYYYRDPQKPFCENIVKPKLNFLLERFGKYTRMGVQK